MVLSWSLLGDGADGAGGSGSRASAKAKYDFRLDEQDWEKVCWGRLPKGEARSLAHQLSRRAKWAAVLRRAARPEGGGWREDFRAADMTPERLQALARVIDSEFFQGTFHRGLARRGGRRMSYHWAEAYQEGQAAGGGGGDVVVMSAPPRRFRFGLAPLTVVRPPPPSLFVEENCSSGGGGAAVQPDETSGGGGGGRGRWNWLRRLARRGPHGGNGCWGEEGCGPCCGGAGPCGHCGGMPGAERATDLRWRRGGTAGPGVAVGGGGGSRRQGAQYTVGRGQQGELAPGGAGGQSLLPGPSASYENGAGRVIFYRRVWSSVSPSPGRPVRIDGVPCTTKLSWLAHTLGHEMLHALLDGMCGEYARDAPSNVVGRGHGYSFLVLNWYLLGHRGHTYDARGWWPRAALPCRL